MHQTLLRQGYHQATLVVEDGDCLGKRSGVPPGLLQALPTILGCYSEPTLSKPSHLTRAEGRLSLPFFPEENLTSPSTRVLEESVHHPPASGSQNVHMRCAEYRKESSAVMTLPLECSRQEYAASFHSFSEQSEHLLCAIL